MPAIETSAAKPRKSKFPSAVFVRCRPAFTTAVQRAADRSMLSLSAYVRLAVLSQLHRDGVEVDFDDDHERPECAA
jgi:hypothetical protein